MAKSKGRNDFSRFFSSSDYIILKNQLFNYKFRKYMLKKVYVKYNKENNPKIVDIGCGISPVSPDYKKTIFIDADKSAMDFLKKLGHATINSDIEKIKLKNSTIDYVFCSEVLEHVPDYKKGIKEILRIMKKNSMLFLTVPTHMKYWAFDDDYVAHLRRFDPKKLVHELENMGFEIVESKPIGSFAEREITKILVRQAMKKKNGVISKGKIFLFGIINKIFFGITYLSYLFNNPNNSSIILIACRKK